MFLKTGRKCLAFIGLASSGFSGKISFQEVDVTCFIENKYCYLFPDLNDIPCILIVCEKGKMGITYPPSLRYALRGMFSAKPFCLQMSSVVLNITTYPNERKDLPLFKHYSLKLA